VKIVADENIPHVAECFSSLGQVESLHGRRITPQVVKDADVLVVRSVTPVDSDLLVASRVRFVGTATIGFDHIDTDYLTSNGTGFASAPGSNANSVAEYVIAALLSVAEKKRLRLEGKSIGIIGVGNVGSRVEKKVRALGMEPFLNDPPLYRQTGDSKYLPLEQLFDCDFVTVHTPLTFEGTDATFHLANEEFFNSLKTGCVFINTARGGIVDTAALKRAIRSGKLGGAVLDVWENEPSIDVELLRMVDLSTPHIAGYSLEGKIGGMIMVYEAACKYFGIEAKYGIEDFLPEPQVKSLEVDTRAPDKQQILHETVQRVYPINRDDFNTREIAMVSPENRARFFDDLRKTYPVRREFHSTAIALQGKDDALAKKLRGIGFRIAPGAGALDAQAPEPAG